MTGALRMPEWVEQADCAQVGGDFWFPDEETSSYSALPQARAICAGCPVRQDCLDWAVARPQEVGIWAGTTEAQRLAIRNGKVPCRGCGASFKPVSTNGKYCGEECRQEARLERQRAYDQRQRWAAA